MALRLGEPAPVFTREVMQSGNASLKRSIEEVVRSIRFGISDVEYARLARGWAGQVLIAAGKPKGVRAQTQAILDAARGQTMYVADPVHMEWIQTAVRTLCLKPGQCNPIGDCDDLAVVIATVCILIGIRTQLVEQHWENADQDHILDAVQDESGQWLKVDPSTDWPVGRAATADREIWIDPMQDVTPQLVALGRVRISHVALGATAITPYDQAATDLQNEVVAAAGAGDTYLGQGDFKGAVTAYQAAGNAGATSVGPEIDLVGAASVTQPSTQKAWTLNAALAAVNAAAPSQADATLAQGYIRQMIALYQQAISDGRKAMSSITPGQIPATPENNVGMLKALGVGLGAGVVVGLGVHFWRKERRRR